MKKKRGKLKIGPLRKRIKRLKENPVKAKGRRQITKSQVKGVFLSFVSDLTAVQASLMTGVGEISVFYYYQRFREDIYQYSIDNPPNFKGQVEIDQSMFGTISKPEYDENEPLRTFFTEETAYATRYTFRVRHLIPSI